MLEVSEIVKSNVQWPTDTPRNSFIPDFLLSGLIVQPNKKYSKTVSMPFHVSQAVLDVSTATGDADVQLILKSDQVDYILCSLNKTGRVQTQLDLNFSEGDEISFRSVGKCWKKTTNVWNGNFDGILV